MVDSFVFHIDWTTVASVIGLLASLIALFTTHDGTVIKPLPPCPLGGKAADAPRGAADCASTS
jgi:hypothetical protein